VGSLRNRAATQGRPYNRILPHFSTPLKFLSLYCGPASI
jgi:hypothetical protein